MRTCFMDSYITKTAIMDTCIRETCIMGTCIIDTYARVTWPERPKGAKDEVKRPKGHPAGSGGPEGP